MERVRFDGRTFGRRGDQQGTWGLMGREVQDPAIVERLSVARPSEDREPRSARIDAPSEAVPRRRAGAARAEWTPAAVERERQLPELSLRPAVAEVETPEEDHPVAHLVVDRCREIAAEGGARNVEVGPLGRRTERERVGSERVDA